VRLFLLDVVQDRLTHRPQRVPSIQDVEDDIGRVDDFVEFAINSPRSAFGVDGLNIICVRLWLDDGRG
jgi:hypothetical protein